MLMPLISVKDQKLLFVADTIPSHAHLHVPWVMGYDVRPLQTMLEKEELLSKTVNEDWLLFYDHDPFYEVSKVIETEKGFGVNQEDQLRDFID